MADNKPNQTELLAEVLGVTRDQLSKAMNLNAELEALLLIERRKVEKLQEELSKKSEEKEDKK
jgi:hypothetical protein